MAGGLLTVREQEVDPLRLLEEAHAVKAELDTVTEEALRRDFVAEYTAALQRVRAKREATDDLRAASFANQLSAFGSEAGNLARRSSLERVVISLLCRDEHGIVADAARAIADHDGNIIRSSLALVADHAVTSFLVGFPSPGAAAAFQIEARTAVRDGPFALRSDLTEPSGAAQSLRLAVSVSSFDSRSVLDAVTEVLLSPPYEDDNRVAFFRLRYVEEQGDRGGPQRLDAGLVVPVSDGTEPPFVSRRFEQVLRERLPEATVSVRPAEFWDEEAPTPGGLVRGPDEAFALVMARGRPGFVRAVASALNTACENPRAVRAMHAFVLGDVCTVAALLRADVAAVQPAELCRALETTWKGDVDCRVHFPTDLEARASSIPTHELALAVGERPGVIADITDELLRLGVNIVWLSSDVLAPVYGDDAPRCVVVLLLAVPPDCVNALDRRLQSLARAGGWLEKRFSPWSLSGNAALEIGDSDTRSALARIESTVEQIPAALEEQLEELRPRMVGFEGHVGVDIGATVGDATGQAAWPVTVVIGAPSPGTAYDLPLVTKGPASPEVPFDVTIKSSGLTVEPGSIRMTAVGDSPVEARFVLRGPAGSHDGTVLVRHSNRLVQMVPITVTKRDQG